MQRHCFIGGLFLPEHLEKDARRLIRLAHGTTDGLALTSKLVNVDSGAVKSAADLIELVEPFSQSLVINRVVVSACENCPQLASEIFDLAKTMLELLPQGRLVAVCDSFTLLCKSKSVREGQVALLKEAFEKIMPSRRMGFALHGVSELFKQGGFESRELEKILDRIVANLNSGREGFLPPEALSTISCGYFHQTCSATKNYFLRALEAGTLVKTTAFISGSQKTIYVKGYWSESGNVLGFEPESNSVYALLISGGEITDTRFNWEYSDKTLQWRIFELENQCASLRHQI
ncbi:hypothetical protein FJZ26_00360 [Candidatus Parvarchaeota archaeon]|nr:hypothetical protein [Candidatus Parvarchaeota archaeon]